MNLKITLLLLLVLFHVSTINAQKKTHKKIKITGYITDINDSPIKGASIIIDNVPSNTFTNKKGFYKVKVTPNIKSITAYSFQHGGLQTNFTGKTKINFILASDTSNPHFISIEEGEKYNTGYGKMGRKNATTSMSKIEQGEDQLNTYTNIYDMIEAQVTGVIVRNRSIMIRGLSSINNQGEPLFVVDGSITPSIDYISPNDIRSITILKGASASIYGARGTFGVIVINLKKGKEI